jgi:trk system potassium uptake protein TrkH
MQYSKIIRQIGLILLFNAIFLVLSVIISLIEQDNAVMPLLYTAILTIVLGAIPLFLYKPVLEINKGESVLIIVLGWIISCIIGTIPYAIYGGEFSLINAWFESVSGFTTTGSTVLNNIEAIPHGLLFWRSSTHFIGGMGIILFTLFVMPESRSSRLSLIRSDMSDLARKSFSVRSNDLLRIFATVYISMTLLETILLYSFGMNLFDAINHSFATIATGGFSTKNLSIAAFNSLSIEIIIMVFMILSGLNFFFLYNTVLGKTPNIFTSRIVQYFIAFLVIGILGTTIWQYIDGYGSFWYCLRYASFQVISVGTTSGFASADSNNWHVLSKMILIYFTLQCACTGSTSGGMKFDRVLIFIKSINKKLKQSLHPNAIIYSKIGDITIDENEENNTIFFILLYVFIIFASTVFLAAMNVDLMTGFSSVIATIGNVGPGFGEVSSLSNFDTIPVFGKLVLSVDMLLGRMEIFAFLSVFYLRS